MNSPKMCKPGKQRLAPSRRLLGLRAALLPLFGGSPAAVNVPTLCQAAQLPRKRSRHPMNAVHRPARQQGWLEKAAVGLPQSKVLRTLAFILLTSTVIAGPRTSINYTVPTDTADAGGQRSTSATYRNNGSVTDVADLSTSANATVKPGYIGQLTDVTALQFAASPATVNEGSTRQFSASLLNDDLTTTSLLASDVSWGVHSGPLTGVDANGLATAAVVYQNTAASVHGVYSTFTATGALTVLNVSNDDLPGYSGDGLDDAWQAQYFGLNNPNAAPTFDADFDGHNNLFEFTAGLNPTLGSSRFLQDAARPTGQPTQMNIVISPRLPDRTYSVKTSTTLGPSAVWTPLTGFTVTDNGNTRTITDTSATGARKFYTVEISKP